MEISKITELLTAKFSGVRKDGIEQLATSIQLLVANDNIETYIENLSEESVNGFVTNWRKTTDSEISKANRTLEQNLKNKFDFVEKSKQPKQSEPNQPENLGNDIDKLIASKLDGITKPLLEKIAQLENHNLAESRMKVINGLFDSKTPAEFKKTIISEFNSKKFESDDDFNSYVNDKKESIKTFKQDLINCGLVTNPVPTFGSTDSNGVSEAVKAMIKNKQSDNIIGKKII